MMHHLLNHIFYAINRNKLNYGFADLGIISSVDPVNYSVKVILQPDEVETSFIPYCTPIYGWVAPPVGGEQALVFFQDGNKNVPVCALLLYWDSARAPGVATAGDTQPGEKLLRHSSGAYLKLTNAGKVLINGHTEIDITTPTLNITTTGNLSATIAGDANITATGTATLKGNNVDVTGNSVTLGDGTAMTDALVKLNALIAWANSHVHSDPQGGNTGVASPALTTAVGTTVIRGA